MHIVALVFLIVFFGFPFLVTILSLSHTETSIAASPPSISQPPSRQPSETMAERIPSISTQTAAPMSVEKEGASQESTERTKETPEYASESRQYAEKTAPDLPTAAAAATAPSAVNPVDVNMVPAKTPAEGLSDLHAGMQQAAESKGGKQEVSRSPQDYETAATFYQKLAKLKAQSFTLTRPASYEPLWVCQRTDRVIDVFQGLKKRNILSVPVLLKDSQTYFGFIDMMDIVRYVIKHFGPQQFSQEQSFMKKLEEEKEFAKKTVNDLMEYPLSNKPQHRQVPGNYSALAVYEPLARERNVRRISIVSSTEERKLIHLVTRSQVVKFLHQNLELVGDKRFKPVSMCKSFFKEVISVKERSPALAAFDLMLSHNIEAVAVVDEQGRLTGNISVRDLKVIGHDACMFWRLDQQVDTFLLHLRKDFEVLHKRPHKPVYATPSSTLQQVIGDLVQNKVHRVYICSDKTERKPIGVISLKDIILEVFE